MISVFRVVFAPFSLLFISAALLSGGAALWAGVAYVVFAATALDAVWQVRNEGDAESEPDILMPTAMLSVVFAAAFAAFIPGATTAELIAGTLIAGAVFGTIANIVAHELIHQEDRPLRFFLGMVLETLSLDPADTVGHELHHSLVATPADPSSARKGEGFWHFLTRSIPGAAAGSFQLERRRLGGRMWSPGNRVLQALVLQAAVFALFYFAAGWRGLAAFVFAGVLARIIVEATKYSSHYGLVRVPGSEIEMRHSWNAKGGVSSRALFNAGWHSDHHVNDERPYRQIQLPDDAPINPHSAGMTFAYALVPPLWFSVMDPLVENWMQNFASPEERAVAEAA